MQSLGVWVLGPPQAPALWSLEVGGSVSRVEGKASGAGVWFMHSLGRLRCCASAASPEKGPQVTSQLRGPSIGKHI